MCFYVYVYVRAQLCVRWVCVRACECPHQCLRLLNLPLLWVECDLCIVGSSCHLCRCVFKYLGVFAYVCVCMCVHVLQVHVFLCPRVWYACVT